MSKQRAMRLRRKALRLYERVKNLQTEVCELELGDPVYGFRAHAGDSIEGVMNDASNGIDEFIKMVDRIEKHHRK